MSKNNISVGNPFTGILQNNKSDINNDDEFHNNDKYYGKIRKLSIVMNSQSILTN